MGLISKTERTKLYNQVKAKLGYPIRTIAILSEGESVFDTLFEMAMQDYSSYLGDWLITNQWSSLEGLNITTDDLLQAVAIKSNEYIDSFTRAYSKQLGHGTNAYAAEGWELKKDYVEITAGSQHYVIPANREVNQVLWENPPQLNAGGGYFGGSAFGSALSWGAGYMGYGFFNSGAAFSMQPVTTMMINQQQYRSMQKVLQSELTYKITGNADGTKNLYLYPIPGSRYEMNEPEFKKHYTGTKVWYFYYDTTGKDREKCLDENDDIIKLPTDVPTRLYTWENLNNVARQQVRDLFIAHVMISEANVRGFYSGAVAATDKPLTMDYGILREEGLRLQEQTQTRILATLQKLSVEEQTRIRAEVAENVNRAKKYQPVRGGAFRVR